MKENMNYVLIAALSLSVILNIFTFLGTQDDELKNAAKKLSVFGVELGKVTKNNPLTEKQKNEVVNLANVPVPVVKAVDKNAVFANGINNANFKPVVLRSDTGEEIQPCGSIKSTDTSIEGCGIQIIDPSKELASAINATKPIHGKILKDGKEIPATFIVEVKALYKGSWCQTYVSSGEVYTICWDLPNF